MQTLDKAFRSGDDRMPAPNDPEKNKRLRTAAKRWSTRRQMATSVGMVLLLMVLTGLYIWANRTGRLDVWALQFAESAQTYLAGSGFAANHINIHDLERTSIADLHRALGAKDGDALTALQPKHIAARLEQLPWIAAASVQRQWPHTLNIWIEEHRPMAVLHHPEGAYALDFNGQIIAHADADLMDALPNIAGAGAEEAAENLLLALSQFPDISSRFVGATRVSHRRWDLYLAPGVEIRLPERGERAALQKLQDMAQFNDIFAKEWVAIDLRTERPVILR